VANLATSQMKRTSTAQGEVRGRGRRGGGERRKRDFEFGLRDG
jgi:hypothetical protein